VYWARFFVSFALPRFISDILLSNSVGVGWCLFHLTTVIIFAIAMIWAMFHVLFLETKYFHGYIVDSRVCGVNIWGYRSREQDAKDVESMTVQDRSSQSSIASLFQGMELTDIAASTISDVRLELIKKNEVPLIDFSRLVINLRCMLGSGSSARVYKGKWCSRSCAVKILFTVEITPDEIRRALIEASMLHRLQASSQHVVGLYGVAILPPSLSVVLELCSEGSLNDILYARVRAENVTDRETKPAFLSPGRALATNHFAKELSWAHWLELALGACRGVAAVAGMLPGLSHNDIKSANFLVHLRLALQPASNAVRAESQSSSPTTIVTESMHVSTPLSYITKISDVEFASQGVTPEHCIRGETPNWAAPEVLSCSAPVSPASDVYALGGVLYEILTRRVPFDGEPAAAVATCIRAGRQPPLPDEPWTTLVKSTSDEVIEVAGIGRWDAETLDADRFIGWFSAASASARLEAESRARMARVMYRARAHEPSKRPTALDLAAELEANREHYLKAVADMKMEARRASFNSMVVRIKGPRITEVTSV
jgi:serine/threonine protein kinase